MSKGRESRSSLEKMEAEWESLTRLTSGVSCQEGQLWTETPPGWGEGRGTLAKCAQVSCVSSEIPGKSPVCGCFWLGFRGVAPNQFESNG